MTATAHQLRRRRTAAGTIVARLATAPLRKRFIKAAPMVCPAPAADALYAAIAGYTDYVALLALADDIAPPKRRVPRRRKTEIL